MLMCNTWYTRICITALLYEVLSLQGSGPGGIRPGWDEGAKREQGGGV